MEWRDEGIVLSARRHGETSAIVTLLTREHGCHAGLVKGGFSKRSRAVIEPGNRAHAVWRGRLAEHLGLYALETVHCHGAILLDDGDRLSAMAAALAVAEGALPEREPHGAVFAALEAFLDALEHEDLAPEPAAWGGLYVKWELGLLRQLGFGLQLNHCAATGVAGDLVWVSPKSASAVCREAGEPYRDRLLPLPGFLLARGGGAGTVGEVMKGLRLTGYFLDRHLFSPHGRAMPQARARLVERMARLANEPV
ncbi:MAG: DNA repair protein RecO [Alphaproteobacteria bacterium]|nr:DNA repair protein RecO [Alphaproteobacteria bacterium]MBF0249022.1 DNA repair protein RecO [Alphaproteobacteria bacterium]